MKQSLVIVCLAFFMFSSGCSAQPYLSPDIPEASRILDSSGELIAVISRENRIPVLPGSVSKYMLDAIVAIEDSRFYKHHGVDPVGMSRALYRNLTAGRVLEGGSTITQQLAKNLYLKPERTVRRKLEELFITAQLERKYTKQEILNMYLNQIYFGQGAYGVEAAARTYFNKSAKDLGLAESAMLAGIPRAPSDYSPSINFDAAKARQKAVLGRMVALGMIDQETAERAGKDYLQPSKTRVSSSKAPYFTNEISNFFEHHYQDGLELLYSGGLTIYTTLDLKMQEAAETALVAGLKNSDPALNGTIVALDPQTGQIKAMVGGKDFNSSQYNRSFSKIQPGSTFKPFLYAAAIDQGFTAGTTITCEPVSFLQADGTVYSPYDFNEGYHYRPFTLKEALYTSDNVVAVILNNLVGPSVTAEYAKRMGIESTVLPVLSLPLGTAEVTPIEMVRAYATLASGGYRSKPYFIKKVTDSSGRILEENQQQLEKALDEKTAYIITDMLIGVLKEGGTAPAVSSIIGRTAAGKTGTTEEYKDAWFVGYTPELTAAVYVGFDNKEKAAGRTGAQIAAPIWAGFIKEALKGIPPSDFPIPSGVVKVKLCADDGLLAGEFNTRVLEAAFVRGTEPTSVCPGTGPGAIIYDSSIYDQDRRQTDFSVHEFLPDLDSSEFPRFLHHMRGPEE